MKLNFTDYLVEAASAAASPRIPHPEDSIFNGIDSAKKYVQALKEVIDHPNSVSIKWDGSIALYFGRNSKGQFVVTDKYMFFKPEGHATSPEDWVKYDQARGANRGDLYNKIKLIWDGLEKAVGNTRGFYKGDLMWAGVLQPVNGRYEFSPTTVKYSVPVNSELGKKITGKVAGVVVFQYLSDETAKAVPWDGTGLRGIGNVAILTPSAGIKFKLAYPSTLIAEAESAVNGEAGKQADAFLSGLSGVARGLIQQYMNKKITKQTSDSIYKWLKTNANAKQYRELVLGNAEVKKKDVPPDQVEKDSNDSTNTGYLYANANGLNSLFEVWNAIYQLKDNLAQQLEQQITGFDQYVGDKKEGEGFVFPSKEMGPVKLVNRAGFSATHFAK